MKCENWVRQQCENDAEYDVKLTHEGTHQVAVRGPRCFKCAEALFLMVTSAYKLEIVGL